MGNTLKVSMIETIRELAKKGWSQRRIAEELGIHRKTVRNYLGGDSKCTISPPGDPDAKDSKCTIVPTGPVGRKSQCSIHDEYIKERLKLGLSAQRIFQDLKAEKGFEGGYDSVKRYVRKLGNDVELPFRRMEALPGTECQVDYGTGAWIVGADGKRRKTHLFRAVLSCSRKAYSEASFTQETECFLRALENAFRHFGGVPEAELTSCISVGVTTLT